MMMGWEQLHRLPVQTESGHLLGVVDGVTVDVDAHDIFRYEVKPMKILTAFFSKALLISPLQVISVSEDVMIVKDSVAPEEVWSNSEFVKLAKPQQAGQTVRMSEDKAG